MTNAFSNVATVALHTSSIKGWNSCEEAVDRLPGHYRPQQRLEARLSLIVEEPGLLKAILLSFFSRLTGVIKILIRTESILVVVHCRVIYGYVFSAQTGFVDCQVKER